MTAEHNANIDRLTVIGHTPGGEKWVNVFHLDNGRANGTSLTSAHALAIRDRFATFYNAIKALQNQNYGVDQFVVKNMDATLAGEQFEMVPAAAIVGTAVTGPIPAQNAIVVSWRTALAGRSFRGRTYLAGFDKTAMDDNNHGLTSANQTVIGNAARALVDGLATDTTNLVIWSRLDDAPLPPDGRITPVNNLRVGRIFDTQRRRRNKFNEAYVAF